MSNLIRWFEKRKEIKALETVQRHLALTIGIVEDLEKSIDALARNNEVEMERSVQRVASREKEADKLRRRIMDYISKGELPPIDRADLMDLVKKVDMVADWSRESTRILKAIPMTHLPALVKDGLMEMAQGVKSCAISLQKCINRMILKPEEALKAADAVELEEEKVDDIHERVRLLLGKIDLPSAGITVLVAQLLEALEMVGDSCEDAVDQVRVIAVRR
ncbi:DUF47 family protein [Candidatus Bathyarchaeota archaeon]|nr:DUF47 family protein [Candidatus Bathyarchaeota archaeon]